MNKLVLLKRQRKRTGASSTRPLPSRRQFRMPSVYPLVLALVLGVFVAGGYQASLWLTGLSIERVAISGEFRQVQRKQIAGQVQPFLSEGFVFVDLEGVRAQLESIPWVYQVTVVRQWPDQLIIRVTEQRAIARWDKQGFINHRGDFFAAKEQVFIDDLPLLQGPVEKASEMMADYRDLGELLRQQGLVLRRLSMDERGNWSAVLEGGVTIILGGDEVMGRVQRFVSAYQKVLAEKFNQVERIDMRYSKGLAVAWRKV